MIAGPRGARRFLRVFRGATASICRDIGGETRVRVDGGREPGVLYQTAILVRTYSVPEIGAEVVPMAIRVRVRLDAATRQVGVGAAVRSDAIVRPAAGQGQYAIGTLDGARAGNRRGNKILLAAATSGIAQDRR